MPMAMPNLNNSSAASAGTGEQTYAGNAFYGGSVNFGAASSSGLSPIVMIAIAAGVALWVFSNRKR